MPLYRGTGGDYWPNVPATDALLTAAMSRRGLAGSRTRGSSTFASTDAAQASEYARDGAALSTVEPMEGSLVSWAGGTHDLMTALEGLLYRARREPGAIPHAKGLASFLADVNGDLATFDAYVSMNRMSRLTRHVVDALLDGAEVRELRFTTAEALEAALGGHRGEVWVTGPVRIEELAPAPPAP